MTSREQRAGLHEPGVLGQRDLTTRVAKNKYGMVLEVGPLEKAEHGLNMGWLPLLDFGVPENVAEER